MKNRYGEGQWSDISNRYVNEHVRVWEEYHDQPVPKGYCIHHIDRDKFNNDPSNLLLMKHSDHCAFHMKGRHHTPEARVKIGNASRGKHPKMPPCSEEKRRKLSIAARDPIRLRKLRKTLGRKRLRKYLDK